MSHGYQPQTSDISKTLYRIFFLGVVLGTALGFSIRPWFGGDNDSSDTTDVPVAANTSDTTATTPDEPPAEVIPTAPAEAIATSVPPVTSDPESTAPVGPFNPDVKGLWPARHIFVGIEGTKASVETLEWLNEYKPGGVILRPQNVIDSLQLGALVLQIKQTISLGTTINDAPFIIFQDDSMALPVLDASVMPTADTPPSPSEIAHAQARVARANGVGVFFAPALDIYLPGISDSALKTTSLGSQPEQVTKTGLTYARSLRDYGVLPVVSHFPGAGLSVPNESGVWHIPSAQMDGLAAGMQPFEEAIATGISGVLVGHMAVPGIDPDSPNRSAARSPKLLKILLREKWNYKGVVIADDLQKDPDRNTLSLGRIAVTALTSGCDAVVLLDANRDSLYEICSTLVRQAEHRDFPTAQLQASKARLNTWQSELSATPAPVETPVEEHVKTVMAVNAEAPPTPPVDPVTPVATPDKPNSEETSKKTVVVALPREAEAAGDVKTELSEAIVSAVKPTDTATAAPSPEEKTEEMVTVSVHLPNVSGPNEDASKETAPEKETEATKAQEATSTNADPTPNSEAPADENVPTTETPGADEKPIAADGAFVEHTIERGDTLLELAKRYEVSVDDLKKWNDLESQTIKFGFKLNVRPIGSESATRKVTGSNDVSPADPKNAETITEKPDAVVVPSPEGAPEPSVEAPLKTTTPLNGAEPEEAPTSPDGATAPNTEANTETEVETPSEMAAVVDVPAAAEEAESVTVEATTPEITEATSEEETDAAAPALAGSDPEVADGAEKDIDPTPRTTPQPPNTDKRTHTAKAGETVGGIASEYGIDAGELRGWNGVEDGVNVMTEGTTLTVYLPVAAAEDVSTPPGEFEIHVVVAGDNLRRIANHYGVTQKAIVELNELKSPDHVQLGWKLKIPKK